MTRPLAPRSIRITLDGRSVELRPTLRAAALLASGRGFKATYEGILSGSLSVMAELIEIAGDYPDAVASLIREIDQAGIVRLDVLQKPLLELLVALVDADQEETDQPTTDTGAKQSITDYTTQLFQIGTGVLGWTPAVTWSATPAEIKAAYAGRVDLIKAIFGSGDKDQAPALKPESLTQKIKNVFAGFSTTKVERQA